MRLASLIIRWYRRFFPNTSRALQNMRGYIQLNICNGNCSFPIHIYFLVTLSHTKQLKANLPRSFCSFYCFRLQTWSQLSTVDRTLHVSLSPYFSKCIACQRHPSVKTNKWRRKLSKPHEKTKWTYCVGSCLAVVLMRNSCYRCCSAVAAVACAAYSHRNGGWPFDDQHHRAMLVESLDWSQSVGDNLTAFVPVLAHLVDQ